MAGVEGEGGIPLPLAGGELEAASTHEQPSVETR